jgi:tripartite-type tricarboxylate transporter receptor subunit TctC
MSTGSSRRAFLSALGLAAATITIPAPLRAQGFPARPINVVIMYAPGGGTDVLMRKLAEELARARGWTVAISNRPGAVGGIANTSRRSRRTAITSSAPPTTTSSSAFLATSRPSPILGSNGPS